MKFGSEFCYREFHCRLETVKALSTMVIIGSHFVIQFFCFTVQCFSIVSELRKSCYITITFYFFNLSGFCVRMTINLSALILILPCFSFTSPRKVTRLLFISNCWLSESMYTGYWLSVDRARAWPEVSKQAIIRLRWVSYLPLYGYKEQPNGHQSYLSSPVHLFQIADRLNLLDYQPKKSRFLRWMLILVVVSLSKPESRK